MFGLADCNNFFVSCERSANPALAARAVVVLSNNDGCVVARSNEAKRMGVRMGQPAFELRKIIESGALIALSGNHLLYRDISLQVHDIFRRFVPDTIDYSVDESFLNVSGIPHEYLPSIGEAIYDACMAEARIPVTIGFAPTKTLAKVITEITKKKGLHVGMIRNEAEAAPILESQSIADLWGIGRRLARRLYQSGIYTMADFARRNQAWVRQKLGVTGERSWLELHCQPCISLAHVERPMQDSISESRTFPEDVDDYDYLRSRIVIYASDCARKLRAMKGVCGSVGVFLRTNPFHTGVHSYCPDAMVRLDPASSATPVITDAALRVLDSIYLPGVPMKRGGVWLADISADVPRVPSLFDQPSDAGEPSDAGSGADAHVASCDARQEADMRRFMSVVDSINSGVAQRKISLASQIVKVQRGHNDGYSSSFQAPKK